MSNTPFLVDVLDAIRRDPFQYDIAALDVSRVSSGQINAVMTEDGDVIVKANTRIDLFTYGMGEILPATAGFGTTKFRAHPEQTNCDKGGRFVENMGFVIIGLAARIGRPKLYHPRSADDGYESWIDRFQMTLREALMESGSIDLRYGDYGCRYTLGAVVQRPLMGGVWGPAIELPDAKQKPAGEPSEKPEPGEETESLDRAFVPFRVPAMSDVNSTTHATVVVTTGEKNIRIESKELAATMHGPGPAREKYLDVDRTISTPIRVWLFGFPVAIPNKDETGI